MNILLLTQIVPYPPDSGPKVKTYHVLRYLAERGQRVTLLTFVRPHELQYLDALRPYCSAIHAVPMRRSRVADARAYAASMRSGQPFLVARDALPEMFAQVRRLTTEQRFDIIHADQLTMGQFALAAASGGRVFDAHNAVWTIVDRGRKTATLPRRLPLWLEARRLKEYEGTLCRRMDAVLAVSDIDRQALIAAGAPSDKITVVPIAVDCSMLAPVVRTPSSVNILTASTLFYPPNADGVRWFLSHVFPLIKEQIADATLTIVGPRPPKDIARWAIQDPKCVSVTGYVPDLVPYLTQAAVTVVPVRAASGMRVRILEAMARGVPVVTTSTGVEGIEAANENHLLLADEPVDFANAVVRLLHDRALGETLALNGRRLVEEMYDWRAVLTRVERVYTAPGSDR